MDEDFTCRFSYQEYQNKSDRSCGEGRVKFTCYGKQKDREKCPKWQTAVAINKLIEMCTVTADEIIKG